MIALEDVTYRQGDFSLQVDLGLSEGRRLALMGASGSGKSTLLALIAGFLTPAHGRIRLAGRDVNDLPPAKRPVSMLFQDGNLFPHLDLAANLGLALRPDLRLDAAQRALVEGALARVGLGGMGARKPAQLSGGQASRAALARILLRNHPIVLLDEPFAALDPALRREMLLLLDALLAEREMTLILATHDFIDAERLCNDLCLLEGGRVVLSGAVAGMRAARPAALVPWLA